jgi:hypothetical protein
MVNKFNNYIILCYEIISVWTYFKKLQDFSKDLNINIYVYLFNINILKLYLIIVAIKILNKMGHVHVHPEDG